MFSVKCLVDWKKSITFAVESITNDLQIMETTVVRKPASFRLRTDLLERLKINAARENRTLNNYVESVLLDIVYHEPNNVTKAAIEEAMSGNNQNKTIQERPEKV